MCGLHHTPEAEERPGRAWRLLNTMPDLKGGPAAWGHHAMKVKEELYGLVQSARDLRVYTAMCVSACGPCVTLVDYVVVGPPVKVKELTEDMEHTMLQRDVQFLEQGTPPANAKFLGWMRGSRAGFRAGEFDEEVCHCCCERRGR